jgi:hypothetical protein
MPNVLAPLLMLLLAGSAHGSAVQPEVSGVVSGGYWSSKGQSGTYRVVIVNSGFEHVVSQVFIEWVADPTSEQDGPKVVATVEPKLPFEGVASLQAALKPVATGKAQIILSGVVSALPTQEVHAVLTATSPGQVAIDGG